MRCYDFLIIGLLLSLLCITNSMARIGTQETVWQYLLGGMQEWGR
jgi:hypothetical protein